MEDGEDGEKVVRNRGKSDATPDFRRGNTNTKYIRIIEDLNQNNRIILCIMALSVLYS